MFVKPPDNEKDHDMSARLATITTPVSASSSVHDWLWYCFPDVQGNGVVLFNDGYCLHESRTCETNTYSFQGGHRVQLKELATAAGDCSGGSVGYCRDWGTWSKALPFQDPRTEEDLETNQECHSVTPKGYPDMECDPENMDMEEVFSTLEKGHDYFKCAKACAAKKGCRWRCDEGCEDE